MADNEAVAKLNHAQRSSRREVSGVFRLSRRGALCFEALVVAGVVQESLAASADDPRPTPRCRRLRGVQRHPGCAVSGDVSWRYGEDFRLEAIGVNGVDVRYAYDEDGAVTAAGWDDAATHAVSIPLGIWTTNLVNWIR